MKHFLLLIFLFIYGNALSQHQIHYNFRHIDQSDGLLQNEVLSITQDGSGYIWIGTSNGLQRFDGHRFVSYQDEINDHNPSFTSVDNLQYDKTGHILLSNNSHIGSLGLYSNKLVVYNPETFYSEPGYKFDTYINKHGGNWKLGRNAVYYYDSSDKSMKIYCFDLPGKGFKTSGYIIYDSLNRQTWVSTWKNLVLFDGKTGKAYTNMDSKIHPLLSLRSSNAFSKMMLDKQGNIWIASWHYFLYKYCAATRKISTYSLADIKQLEGDKKGNGRTLLVNCIFQDNRENIWVGTENAGLLKYNQRQNNFDFITSQEQNKAGLNYNYNVYTIFQDKDDNIWVGTDKGINIFNPYHQYFRSIHHHQNTMETIPKNEITGFIEINNGEILAGTWGGGLSLFDSNFHFKKNISIDGIPENNMIWCFSQKSEKEIWVGCQHGYIHIYDPVKGHIINTIHPLELDSSTIRCMKKDKYGNIWFGLHNGKIARWDSALNRFIPFNDLSRNTTLWGAPVLNLFIDSAQNIWASTREGLKKFDALKRTYVQEISGQPSRFHSIVNGIEQYNDSLLLIASKKNGLNFYNINTNKYEPLSLTMPSKSVVAIKKDRQNNILLTTDYGLYKLNLNKKLLQAFFIEPGMVNSAFTANNFTALNNGRWATFTATEIISFRPDSISYSINSKSRVMLTGFRVFDSSLYIDSFLINKKPLGLNYDQNFFTVEYAALDFSNIQEIKYYYKLSGIDKDWVNAGAKNFASYTNLEPGNYIFSVKAEKGENSLETTSFEIIINPPFWKTWWFKSLLILIVILSVFFVLRKIIKTIRFEAELKHKIAETEMKALRAQMNPHFIFNCLNAIDNLIQTNEKEKATTYLARFAKLIRLVLDNSKSNLVPFYKEYEALNLFLQLEQFRYSNGFEYVLKADEEIINGDYKVPPFLVQPFIENAIHHGLMNKSGNDKKLLVEITIKNECIKYTIRDNGIGRKKAMQIKNINKPEHISYGIGISTERLHLFNKNSNGKNVLITDLSNEGTPSGTLVEVSININKMM